VAPEIITGQDTSAKPALDVWSMGCIFYALLTGDLPFDGETVREIAAKIVNCRYKKLKKFPNISKPWRKLIVGML
jgi:serine/threonine protein kinase